MPDKQKETDRRLKDVDKLEKFKKDLTNDAQVINEQRDQAIAQELGISYNTLRTQLSRLYRKLGVQTRVGVAVAAFTELITIRQKEVDARQKSGEEV